MVGCPGTHLCRYQGRGCVFDARHYQNDDGPFFQARNKVFTGTREVFPSTAFLPCRILGLKRERDLHSTVKEKFRDAFLGFTPTIPILSQIEQGSFYREKANHPIGKRPVSYTRLALCQSETCYATHASEDSCSCLQNRAVRSSLSRSSFEIRSALNAAADVELLHLNEQSARKKICLHYPRPFNSKPKPHIYSTS